MMLVMLNRKDRREAYTRALQLEQIVSRIVDIITPTHPQEASELVAYTHEMLRCLRASNGCVGSKRGRRESIQAAVWMVEVMIILNGLDACSGRALITAAIEVLERVEEALRAEGSLPPVRD